jgi:hypothetical protein
MTDVSTQIKEVYTALSQILQSPEAFGLGQSVPEPLANRVETTLRKLGEVLKECEEEATPEVDLAAELSQDADRPGLAK